VYVVVKFSVRLNVRVRTSDRIKFLTKGKFWVKASAGRGIGIGLGLMHCFGSGHGLVLSFVMVSVSYSIRIWFLFQFTISAMVSDSAKDRK
jgi:hypothetical protein